MNRFYYLVISLSLVLYACSSVKETSGSSSTSSSGDSKESAVLWQQTSAEYTALCYQAFNAAKSYLTTSGEDIKAGSANTAIVMDLDETVLDNSPYNGYLINKGENYSRNSWKEWTDRAEAELIPGVLEFIQFARDRGFPIYFISNRREDELDATIQNLQRKGIEIDSRRVFLRREDRSKSKRREKVMAMNGIVMLIGDNLADFDDLFEEQLSVSMRKDLVYKNQEKFGRKFIILPNAMYGDWERTLTIPDPKVEGNPGAKGDRKFIRSFE